MRSILDLPKIDLHCHLDGSLSLETMKVLASLTGKPLPYTDEELRNEIQVPDDCESLAEYLKRFDLPLQYLTTETAFKTAVYRLMKEASQENIVYMEIRFAPLLSVTEELSAEAIVESTIEGLKLAREQYGIRGNMMISFMRNHPVEENLKLLRKIMPYIGNGVCGIDTAGNEAAYPTSVQKDLFQYAHKMKVPFTIHAGETGSVSNIAEAVELGAKRLGHGIALEKDRELAKLCASKQIGIEMCPKSNLQTKAVLDAGGYPAKQFVDQGLKVTVNTDNRTVTNTTMTNELEWINRHFGLEPEMLIRNAAEVSFAGAEDKHWVLQQCR